MSEEKKNEVLKEVDSMFNIIQKLDIRPTEYNLQILTGCLGSLRFIYNTVKEDADNGAEANAE